MLEYIPHTLERFSFKFRKTLTQEITLTNHAIRTNMNNTKKQSELEANTSSRWESRENS